MSGTKPMVLTFYFEGPLIFCEYKSNFNTVLFGFFFFFQVSPVKDRTNSYTGMPLKLRHLMVKDATKTAKMALKD